MRSPWGYHGEWTPEEVPRVLMEFLGRILKVPPGDYRQALPSGNPLGDLQVLSGTSLGTPFNMIPPRVSHPFALLLEAHKANNFFQTIYNFQNEMKED